MAKVAGKSGTFTFNALTMYASDVSFPREIGEVDVTNLQSSGNYECIGDIKKTTFSATVFVESGSAPNIQPYETGTTTLAVTGGRTITGTAFIFNAEHRVSPRGAYTISIRGSFTGAVTES